ncbi:hypothetical protein Sjap_010153 [Stephania japonica]|uniref:TF-B3 domain-containing protein n=1 Tax=Stephania japonica TaxID=461633 RepID=A0AAP0J8X6_9MAGN
MRRPPLRSPATENRPHFFKIIHSGVIHGGRLRIPTKFMSNFRNGLSDFTKLSVAGGKIWKIRLKKDSSGMWFEDGLQEFIKYYSINAGHLLLFRYDGNSKFRVVIFDMTATEIGYPCSNAAVDVGSELHKKKDGPKTYDNHYPILKCKEEEVGYDGNGAKPFAGKVTSQFEKRRTGKLKFIELSDGDTVKTNADDDVIESSEETETLGTSEDDVVAENSKDDDLVETSEEDAIEILDVDTFHKNVCRKINFDECKGQGMEKLCNQRNKVDERKQGGSQSLRRRFSLRTLSNKTAEVAPSRFHKLASTSSKCNHLLQCKKEPFESKGKERQLSHDKDNRRQMKDEINEAKPHDLKKKGCLKASETLVKEENNAAVFVDESGDSSFRKNISSRNMVFGNCGEMGTKFQQYNVLSKSVANGTKSSVGDDASQHYKLQNRPVLCSGNVNSKLNPHCQDKGKAGQFVGGSKRSRVTHVGSEEFCHAPDKIAKLIASDGGSSRRINNEGVYPYPCKEFRSSHEFGMPVIYPGKTRGLVDSCETNEVRNRGVETFNINVKKEVLEMDVHSFEKIPSELAEWRKATLAKFVASKSGSGLQINGSIKRTRQNSDSSKQGLQTQGSPVPLLNQTTITGNYMTVKAETKDIMVSAASTSGNACFQVTMRRSYVNNKFSMSVPFRFASVMTKHSSEDVVLQLPNGRSWHVKVKCYEPACLRLNRGWKEFVLDNQLKEDDVCVFKADEKEPNVIKVVILRST